ncbi:hypothetical protein [Actinoplanes sp. NPDC023714]|uniref:hypothetical protein n=1 Tax=Actinoplanes sp. NPDC023714 TaxID=3154322 RepID=UPI0033DD5485
MTGSAAPTEATAPMVEGRRPGDAELRHTQLKPLAGHGFHRRDGMTLDERAVKDLQSRLVTWREQNRAPS